MGDLGSRLPHVALQLLTLLPAVQQWTRQAWDMQIPPDGELRIVLSTTAACR